VINTPRYPKVLILLNVKFFWTVLWVHINNVQL
jgi:hypothetical protein